MTYARPRTRRRRGKAEEEAKAPGKASTEKSNGASAQAQLIPLYAHAQEAHPALSLLERAPAASAPQAALHKDAAAGTSGANASTEENERAGDALRPLEDEAEESPEVTAATAEEEAEKTGEGAEGVSVAPAPDVSGTGETTHDVAYSITLRGRTEATFNSSFRVVNGVTSPGTGCTGCAQGNCLRVRGVIESTFAVTTRVTLPSVSDFPNLRPCQQQRVQDAITNVLAPHEQQHVAAFNTYRGVVNTPFDVTVCRDALQAAMQRRHDALDSARQSSARAAGDALDPFQFDVDIDCRDSPDAGAQGSDAGGPAPDAGGPVPDAGGPIPDAGARPDAGAPVRDARAGG